MSGETPAVPSGLGNLVKEYKLSSARVRQILMLMLLSTAMASCFFLTAIFTNDVSPSGIRTRVGILFPGLLFMLPGVVGIRELVRLSGSSIALYENGLILRKRNKLFITTWDEIEAYVEDIACRITKKDGEEFEFGPSIEDVEEVQQEIRDQTLRRRLPQMKAAIRAGSSVQFTGIKPFESKLLGKGLNNFAYAFSGLTVDAQGISTIDEGKHMAWKEVTDYGITQEKMGRMLVDAFFIQSATLSFRTRYGLLENAHVLLVLCDEMTGLHQRRKPEPRA